VWSYSWLLQDATDSSTSRPDNNPKGYTIKAEMRQYPSPDSWEHANDRQRQRAKRSIKQLKKRSAPVYSCPLFVDDDEEVKLQSPQDVARRTLVLSSVELRAEGVPKKEALDLIEQLALWDNVSSLRLFYFVLVLSAAAQLNVIPKRRAP
jgi:hypothetical protein